LILRFFQFVIVALSLFMIALVSAITTMHFAIHGAEVTVPDFRGLDIAAATRKAAKVNLAISVDAHFYSASTAAGHILTQSPAPGSEWSVRVTDSLGPQRVAIPRITGQPERLASLEVRKLGLDLGTIARMPYGGAATGTVIAQTPQPGAANVDGPNVGLLLGTLPSTPSAAFVMPDLVNSNYAATVAAITRAGLKLGPTEYRTTGVAAIAPINTSGVAQAPKPPIQSGVVLAQRPDAGMHIDASTSIELTVSQ
jgi:beta-lactam-binding protein with PASTA domain